MITLLHVTEDHSSANTGITSAVDALVRQMQPSLQQSVVATGDEMVPLPSNVSEIRLKIGGVGRFWRTAPGGRRTLLHSVQQMDVIHLHGIWMWVQWAAARSARQQGKPFLLSIHGMLEPWIWQRQHWYHQWKKKIYWRLIAFPAFQHASLIHAIHAREAKNLKTYFPHLPIEVISPSLDLEAVRSALAAIEPKPAGDPYILFLGRLHPVKGIDLLIQAFANLDAPRLLLKIAGPTQPREVVYSTLLQKMVMDAGLEGRVEFLGAVPGNQKWSLLRNAWAFCLPSHSEVIGMVNLEAAACRTPVITTKATGIEDAWTECGGMLVETEVEALTQALEQAYRWTVHERAERGENLYRLVESTYSWKATSSRWVDLYQRLAAKS